VFFAHPNQVFEPYLVFFEPYLVPKFPKTGRK
jgi:hypothetical protein